MTGSLRNYRNGLSAEESVARAYEAKGAVCLAKRWRSAAGEIDLVFEENDGLVFVEVKLRKTLDTAAHAILPRQWRRIALAAQVFMDENGFSPNTNMRFDAALIDGQNNMEVIQNAAQFDD